MGCKKHEPDTTPNSLPCLWPVVAAVTRLTPHSLPSLPPCPHNSLRNAMPVQWVAHATNTGVVKAPVIAQKCPQEGRVGRREAAARGRPRRQQSGLGFVQVSCPLEHTSNSAASVCLLPMAARLQPASPPAASHCRLLPFPGRALYAPGLVPGSDSGTTQGHTHRTTGLFGLTAPEIAQTVSYTHLTLPTTD